MILKIAGILLFVLVVGVLFLIKSKGISPISWKMHKAISQSQQLAIKGFDPVSYFEQGKAEKGEARFQNVYKQVKWHFSSAENLEKFKLDPEQFVPQFGGYCAFAVSKGFTATSDPSSWQIKEGKLYLFADNKMKDNWLKALPDILEKGKQKWTN